MTAITYIILTIATLLIAVAIHAIVIKRNKELFDILKYISIMLFLSGIFSGLEDVITILNSLKSL